MSELWIVIGACVIFVVGAALPLIRDRGREVPPPRKETLHDWRNGS